MSTGRYYRWNLHQERARRQSILLQRSSNGHPTYVESADFTDWARITRKSTQRIAQLFGDAMDGVDAWRLEVLAGENNFTIKGGDNTDEGAAAAWVGGFRALLYRDTDYQCVSRGNFNEVDAFNIHHRATSVAAGALNDVHSKYVAGALVGQTVTIAGAGSFLVTGNTATQILLAVFDPVDFPDLGARPFYYIDLAAPVADFDQDVYLDVHLEDWGVEEDAALNHNPGVPGKEVECARREVLIQRLWVRQVVVAPEMPVTSSYTDSTGTRHWVMKVGELNRLAGNEAIPEVDPEAGDHFPAPDDVRAARDFAHFDVGVDHDDDGLYPKQPLNLSERFSREDSVLVIGPDGDPGIYTGASGLQDALSLPGPHTIFLRNGTYALTRDVIIPDRWTIIGESRKVVLSPVNDDVHGIELRGRATLSNVTVSIPSMCKSGIRIVGRQAAVRQCWIQRLDTSDQPAVLFQDLVSGGRSTGASIIESTAFKTTSAPAVKAVVQRANGVLLGDLRSRAVDLAGPSGLLPDNSSAGDFGLTLARCEVQKTNSLGVAMGDPEEYSAVVVLAGSVLLRDCTLHGLDSSVLYVGSSTMVDNAATRSALHAQGCTFLATPASIVSNDNFFFTRPLTQQRSGDVSFTDCQWDVVISTPDLRSYPLHMLDIDLGTDDATRVGSTSVRGGRMHYRGVAATVGAALAARVRANDSRVLIDGLQIIHLTGACRSLLALSASGQGSECIATHTRIQLGDTGVARAVYLSGTSAWSSSAGDGFAQPVLGELSPAASSLGSSFAYVSSRSFWGDDLDAKHLVTTLQDVAILGYTRAAVVLQGRSREDGCSAQLVGLRIDGCRADEARGTYGILVDLMQHVQIVNPTISGLRAGAIVDINGVAGGLSVTGGVISDFAAEYWQDDASVYTELAHTLAKDYSAVAGATLVRGLQVRKGGPGSRRGAGCFGITVFGRALLTQVDVVVDGVHRGVLFDDSAVDTATSLRISGHFTQCTSGIWVNGARGVSGQVDISRATFTYGTLAIWLQNCDIPRIRDCVNDPGASALTQRFLHAEDCTNLEIRNCVARATSSSTLSTVSVERCDNMSIVDCELQGGRATAVLISASANPKIRSTQISGKGVHATKTFAAASRVHALVLYRCGDARLRNVQVTGGTYIHEGVGKTILQDCESTAGIIGTAFDVGESEIEIVGGRYVGEADRVCAVSSGIWLSPTSYDDLPRRWLRASVNGAYAESFQPSEGHNDLTVASVSGRVAAITVHAAVRASVRGCTLMAPSSWLSAMVGNLDYIQAESANESEHRLGCRVVEFAQNAVLNDASPVAIVLQDFYASVVRDNTFYKYGGSTFPIVEGSEVEVLFLYCQTEAEVDPVRFTRVVYVGNQHTLGDRRSDAGEDINRTARTSQYVLLDGNVFTTDWEDAPTGVNAKEAVYQLNTVRHVNNAGNLLWIDPTGAFVTE